MLLDVVSIINVHKSTLTLKHGQGPTEKKSFLISTFLPYTYGHYTMVYTKDVNMGRGKVIKTYQQDTVNRGEDLAHTRGGGV